jgi:type I restriction enzyme, S subunit
MSDYFQHIPNPQSWKKTRIDRFATERVDLSKDGSETLLSVSEYYGVDERRKKLDGEERLSRAESLIGYRKVWPDDLVLNYMLAWKGALGISPKNGIVSPAYSVFNLDKEKVNARFIHHLLRTKMYTQYFRSESTGIIESRLRLYPERMKKLFVCLPPADLQSTIANFLDRETARIDALVEKKERQIALLEEKRQTVVTQIVTKGLNPDVPMKDSGIEWLGDVPIHWEIMKISHISMLRSGYGIVSQQIKDEGDFPVFGGNGLRGFFDKYNHNGNYILIGRQGALCGNINYGEGKFWASEHAIVVYPLIKINRQWLGATLNAMNLNQYSVSAAQPGLAVANITCLKIPYPSEKEQNDIANFLVRSSDRIDAMTVKVKASINLLSERRAALITAAVTGQIDVREAA